MSSERVFSLIKQWEIVEHWRYKWMFNLLLLWRVKKTLLLVSSCAFSFSTYHSLSLSLSQILKIGRCFCGEFHEWVNVQVCVCVNKTWEGQSRGHFCWCVMVSLLGKSRIILWALTAKNIGKQVVASRAENLKKWQGCSHTRSFT